MKRVLALFLTVLMLATLFPASIMAQAETVTKEGFYLVNFGRDVEKKEYDYVYTMPKAEISSNMFDANTKSINMSLYFNDGFYINNIEAAAKKLHEFFSDRPAGSRYINLAALPTVFKHCVKDAIDMEDGVRLVADWLNRFLSEYKSIGGQLDGIAVDLEYSGYTSYYLQTNCCVKTSNGGAPKNLDILQDIVRNERVYQQIIRPKLVEYEKQGLFTFYTKNINPNTGLPYDLSTAVGPEYNDRVPIPVSEISTINRYDDNGGEANSRNTWSWVMSNYLSDCINRAALAPLIKYYPDGILSDYNRADTYSWHTGMTDTGKATGTGVKAGNASNGVFYGSQYSEYYWAEYYGAKTRQQYLKPVSYNKTVYDPTDAYTRVLTDANNVKRLVASARDRGGEDARINVWVPYFHYASTEMGYGNSPYFAETMYHLGLANPEPFFGYIINTEVQSKGKNYDDPNMGDYYYALQVSDEILAELSRVAGASDRKTIVTPVAWNEGYVLSGMYAGGRNIWRITPDTSKVSPDGFKVKDYAPTFRVGDVTITFPQGRIIKDSEITQIGSCGYWVETPANVTPVVTTTANRYANDPSFKDTFTNYKVGAFAASSSSMLRTTSGRPDTYWTVKGTAEIKKSGDNQTLALSGTTTLTNAKMAEHVTAGDYYAKQQAWEVKVTLPSGNYGTVKLLSCSATDGGIKISGGKVYYDQNGSYQELSGVTLSAGTYILKREVDFRTTGSYTSRYTICDASGNRLGGTEMVPMTMITTPVKNITISTAGASAAVEVDDYKLYPTGVSTTLGLYETDQGKKLTDTNAVRTKDTGYRLSWMNAGDTYQVARIYDAKTGTIIKKIEMAPGTDGVAAGVVKVSAGQQIKIAVNVNEEAAPNRPDYDNGDFSWTAEAAERIGLAVGQKLAYSGNDTETPDDSTENEEGDNIFDIVGGDGDLDNGSGDPIISGGDSDGAENPGDADAPGETGEPGAPGEDDPTEPVKKGMSGGVIALIVVLSLAILAGGGVAVYIFIIKPKLAAKPAEETAEKEPWQDSEE